MLSVVVLKLFPVAAPPPGSASESYSLRTLAAAVSADRYYCLLVPLTVPLTLLALYLDWLGFKLFRHNSS